MANTTRHSTLWIMKANVSINKEDISPNKSNVANYFLEMTLDDITYEFIMETFGSFGGNQLCSPYDNLEVPVGAFRYTDENGKERSNKNKFRTTLGLWLVNIILRDLELTKIVGYINHTLGKKEYNKLEQELAYALIEDRITTETLAAFEDKIQWCMPFEDILSPNHTEKLITCTKVIGKKKKELIKKYKEQIDAGDIVAVEKMEKELLDFAKEYMGDDPSMDTILSGAGGSFGNNFKNLYVMRGAVPDPDPNTKTPYKIVTSNFLDGISADEYGIMAGSAVAGAYSRGKKTETGGHWEKLFVAAFQHLKLDPPGSDCGTKRFITVDFSRDDISDYMYSYVIKANGELELIDSKTKAKYDGKKVRLRFCSLCESKTGFCNHCIGDLFYKINAKNIGMVMSQIPSTLKNKCMKGFHEALVTTTKFDAMKAFYPFK